MSYINTFVTYINTFVPLDCIIRVMLMANIFNIIKTKYYFKYSFT